MTGQPDDPYRIFRPVRTRRSFEEAVEQIADAIRLGDLRRGDRLPSERELAARMQVSRQTLREAIRVVSKAELVRVDPGPGGGMSIQGDAVPLELLTEHVQLTIREVASVLEARRLLEPQVAQLAGIYATGDDFEKLKLCIAEHEASLADRVRSNQLDERFHIIMARATGNLVLVKIMRDLLRKLGIAWDMDSRFTRDGERDIELHRQTLEALMSRDPLAISKAMDEHLNLLEHFWEEEAGRPRLRRI